MTTPTFHAPGACLQVDPDLMFPCAVAEQRVVARTVCGPCPVRSACRTWAITTGQTSGVWGGMTEGQLKKAGKAYRRLVRELRPAFAQGPPAHEHDQQHEHDEQDQAAPQAA